MIPQIQSWEFLFVSNCVLVLIFPFLFKRFRYNDIAIGSLIFFPQILGILENKFGIKSDLDFYLILATYHWSLSAIMLFIFCQSMKNNLNLKKYYGIVIMSGLISVGYPLFSSTMYFSNIFWGIIPGTITIDPIISLDSYFLRIAIAYITIAIFFNYRKSHLFLWIPFASLLIVSGAFPTCFSSAKNWPIFSKLALQSSEPAIIYRNEGKLTFFSNEFWQSEINFRLSQLKKKIPENIYFKKSAPLKIFIYENDDEKARWIGARETQIGHFLRGEMHLSEVSPISDIISHELAHLLHGQLDVEIKSFIDPFWFEGFAVALSEDQADLMTKAAALYSELNEKHNFKWPRNIDFFRLYSPRVAYILAGAHASWWLAKKEKPWNQEPSVDIFKSVSIEEKDREWAKDFLSRKPLIENPRLRDCARLEYEAFMSNNQKKIVQIHKKLNNLCGDWKNYPSYHPPSSEEKVFQRDLLKIKDEKIRDDIKARFNRTRTSN